MSEFSFCSNSIADLAEQNKTAQYIQTPLIKHFRTDFQTIKICKTGTFVPVEKWLQFSPVKGSRKFMH